MESLLLVTHARRDFDEGVLSEPVPEAVRDFPGDTAHVSVNPDLDRVKEISPYAEELYDFCLEDQWNGTIGEAQAEQILQYEEIARAGSQFNNCCGNTDRCLSTFAEGEVSITYLTDLTVVQRDDSVNLLENEETYERPADIDLKNNLSFSYRSYFD
jgi:hypothetical protein